MRLIVEKLDDGVYVYLESEQTYYANENSRIEDGSRRLPATILNEECDLSVYASGVHWVFNVEGIADDEDCYEAEEDYERDESCGVRDCRRREDR